MAYKLQLRTHKLTPMEHHEVKKSLSNLSANHMQLVQIARGTHVRVNTQHTNGLSAHTSNIKRHQFFVHTQGFYVHF